MVALTGCNAIGELLGSAVKDQEQSNNNNNNNTNNNQTDLTDNGNNNNNNNNNTDNGLSDSTDDLKYNGTPNERFHDGEGYLNYKVLGSVSDGSYFNRISGIDKTGIYYLQHNLLPTSAQSQVNQDTDQGFLLIVRDAKYMGYRMDVKSIVKQSKIYKITVSLTPGGANNVPANSILTVNDNAVNQFSTLFRIETTDGEVLFPRQ